MPDEQDRRPVRPPHSPRAAAGHRRPAPCTVIGPDCATAVISSWNRNPWHRRDGRGGGIGAHRAGSLIPGRRPTYLPVAGAAPPSSRCPRRDTGRMEARTGPVLVGRGRELGELEHASMRRGQGAAAVLVAGEAGIGKTRLASELADVPATRGRGPGLGRSIDLVGTELPYQPFVEALRPLGRFRRSMGGRRARSCACSSRRWRCSASAAAVPVLLVLEDLHWADASTTSPSLAHNLDDRQVLLLTTYRADEPRPSACAGWPTASGARARRSCSSSAARARGAGSVAGGPRRRPPAGGADGCDRRPLEGNPFFAEELLAAAGDQVARSRMVCATCCCSALPGSMLRRGPVAPGRGRRTRRRLPAAPRRGGPAGARRARIAAPGGRARRPGRRAGDRQLPLPPRCWPRRSTPPSARRARGAAHRLADELAQRNAAPANWRPLGGRGRNVEALAASVGRHARRRRSSAWRRRSRLERALALWPAGGRGRAGAARPCRAVLYGQRNGCGAARSSCAASDRAGRRGRPAARASARRASAATCTQAAGPKPASPRSSAQSSWCRRSRPRSAPRRWRRSGTD